MISLRIHAPRSYMTWVPRVSLTWLLYNLQLDDVRDTDFENSLYAFGQSERRYWVSWIIIVQNVHVLFMAQLCQFHGNLLRKRNFKENLWALRTSPSIRHIFLVSNGNTTLLTVGPKVYEVLYLFNQFIFSYCCWQFSFFLLITWAQSWVTS